MTGGMRLRHPTQRNARLTVEDPGSVYRVPYQCPPPRQGGCGTVHVHKTYHLNLDDQGTVTVNVPLFQRLRSILARLGFTVEGWVEKPPTQVIGPSALMPRVDLTLPVQRGE